MKHKRSDPNARVGTLKTIIRNNEISVFRPQKSLQRLMKYKFSSSITCSDPNCERCTITARTKQRKGLCTNLEWHCRLTLHQAHDTLEHPPPEATNPYVVFGEGGVCLQSAVRVFAQNAIERENEIEVSQMNVNKFDRNTSLHETHE